MAKKSTSTKSSATVGSNAAAKIAENALRLNPDLDEVHVASDGTPFYSRNDAQNYARSLPNHTVSSFKRDTADIQVASADKKRPVAKKAGAEEAPDELTGETINDEPAKTEE